MPHQHHATLGGSIGGPYPADFTWCSMDVINCKILCLSTSIFNRLGIKLTRYMCNNLIMYVYYMYIKNVQCTVTYSLEYNCLCDLWRPGSGNFMQFQMSPSGLSKANIIDLLGCCPWLAVSKHTVCEFVDRCVQIESLQTKDTITIFGNETKINL